VDGADPIETEVTTKTKYHHRPSTDTTATQTDEPQADVSPPSMSRRSHIEVTVNAHLLEALFLPEGATLQALWGTLRLGDEMELTDACYDIGRTLMFEWDGGMWHDVDRIAKDIRKIKRMLAVDANAIILRVRADGAPPLDEAIRAEITDRADRDRIVVVQLDPGKESQNTALALCAIAKALVPKLIELGGGTQPVFIDRLRDVAQRSGVVASRTSKHANNLVHETYLIADAVYAKSLKELEEVVGSPEVARKVLETPGVVTRLDAVVEGLKRLRDEFRVPQAKLATFLCGSVAAIIDNDNFWTGVQRLVDRGIAIERLQTFGDCFWARIGDQALADGIKRLVDRGVAIERLQSFRGCFWARIGDQELADGIKRLIDRGVAIERLQTFGNCFWARIGDQSLADGIQRLVDRGVAIERLQTFGNSFWARIGDQSLADGVQRLVDRGVAIERLQTFGNCFWARIGDRSLADGVQSLIDRGVAIERLQTFGGSFWARIGDQSLTDGIQRLVDHGVAIDRLQSFGDCFWARIGNQSLADGVHWLVTECGVEIDPLQTFGDSFWARMGDRKTTDATRLFIRWLLDDVGVSIGKLASFGHNCSFFSTDESVVRETFAILIDEYGIRPTDLPTRNAFWSHVKNPGKLDSLRVYLATCTTTGAVTKHIAKINGSAGIGQGATKCKFARPRLVHERVEVPKATKQSTLCAFFAKGSVGPSE